MSEAVLPLPGRGCWSFLHSRLRAWLVLALFAALSFSAPAWAAQAEKGSDGAQVMESFARQAQEAGERKVLSDKTKQVIMFLLGVPLLLFLLITGALGIAMGLYGKQVFVLHMVFAGLTVTLALVHVIVGLVWFYPF
jgi:hypothetical protein